YAQISIDGFQTLKRLQAKAYGDENRIKFTFDKYLQDNVQEPYKKGDTLLSLEKTNSAILTTWGKIQPMLESNAKSHKTCFSKEQLNKSSETNSNKTETWTFGVKDLYIDGKPFLGQTYDRILKNFGQYENYSTYKVRPPATEEGTYNYFGVLQYNDMEFEFALGEEERNLTSSDEVFRFDITGSNVELACGLKVGMTTDEVISKFGPRDIYNLNGNNNSFELSAIKHVLKSYKPVGYYSGYSKGMIIYFDPEKFDDMLAKTVVLLIKDDKVDRIVFGYPTAD
ncbi:MAG: DUF5991 domain-containing protein, partial [Bacillota bacterium]|nr:DUF5991 domain-containing protein [Bacillota bacterium]